MLQIQCINTLAMSRVRHVRNSIVLPDMTSNASGSLEAPIHDVLGLNVSSPTDAGVHVVVNKMRKDTQLLAQSGVPAGPWHGHLPSWRPHRECRTMTLSAVLTREFDYFTSQAASQCLSLL